MKSERRHELEQNVLAQWMAQKIEQINPYSSIIVVVGLVIVVGLTGYTWWVRSTDTRSEEGWNAFADALASGVTSDLVDVAERFPNTSVSHWSMLVAADMHLQGGCSLRFQSYAQANQELDQAVDLYMIVLTQSSDSELRERAMFGLARAQETQGDLEQARENYQNVVDQWPDGPYTQVASQRLAQLDTPAAKQFYDKFAKFDPQPAFQDEPGVPGERPSFDLESLPDPVTDDKPVFEPSGILDLEAEGADESDESSETSEEPSAEEDAEPAESADATSSP